MDAAEQQRIEWECGRATAAIAFHLDRGDFETMVTHYTGDVVFHRLGAKLEGRDAILAAMAERPKDVLTRHVHTTTHFVEVGPEEAEAYVYNLTYSGKIPDSPGPAPYGLPQPHLFEFHDRYRKVGDSWQVARRTATMIFKPAG